MVELIGDNCEPKELRIPKIESNYSGNEGNLFLSGAKLWFNNGTTTVIVTSG